MILDVCVVGRDNYPDVLVLVPLSKITESATAHGQLESKLPENARETQGTHLLSSNLDGQLREYFCPTAASRVSPEELAQKLMPHVPGPESLASSDRYPT